MIEPPFTWAVCEGELRLWRGREYLGAIPRDAFAQVILEMARELRNPAPSNDPNVPLG